MTDVYLSQTCPLDPLSLYKLPKVRFECALHTIQVSNSSIRRSSLKEDYHDLALIHTCRLLSESCRSARREDASTRFVDISILMSSILPTPG